MLLVFPVGRWWCPLLPRNERLHTVVGAPLRAPPGAPADEKHIDELHRRYVAALRELYERHKEAYYGREAPPELEIW